MASNQNKIVYKNRFFKIPNYAAWVYPRRIWFTGKRKVCLTFDDGPHPEITPWLLDELKKNQVKATFFWLGNQTEKHPQLYERAIAEGHVVGNHGYYHLKGNMISSDVFKANFDRSQKIIPSKLFRPPFGKLTRKQAKYVAQQSKIVMWSWMSYDFDDSLTNEELLKKAKKQIGSQDILVFHENDKTRERIKEIVPAVIQIVREKGYDFDVIKP